MGNIQHKSCSSSALVSNRELSGFLTGAKRMGVSLWSGPVVQPKLLTGRDRDDWPFCMGHNGYARLIRSRHGACGCEWSDATSGTR